MLPTILVCMNVFAGCGESEPVGRVYNGKPIGRESVPWIVHLEIHYGSLGTYFCGGSVITRNVIMSAGHCMFVGNRLPERVNVWFYSTRDFDGTPVRASKVVVHPRFKYEADIVYDISLLMLAEDLKFNRNLKPVCLPEGKLDVGGKSLLLAGWGATESVKYSKILLYARVVGLKDEDCQQFLRIVSSPFTKRPIGRGPMVCAKGRTTNACEVSG
ncbi:hypothetical protein MTO96_007863 [Rhipicephalus appendiculatus]